jgi:hypothetical protein
MCVCASACVRVCVCIFKCMYVRAATEKEFSLWDEARREKRRERGRDVARLPLGPQECQCYLRPKKEQGQYKLQSPNFLIITTS